ncbi:hypothetical protein K491DRAFT_590644 [Lophiostoma macrostomum CBS 122681]|uniref:ADF-H domain-containing protein n=1 Tax=Lophiostoma macrostomum CBS 122681 TaxID=1314788 RepID=A0A6A6TL40_9PLEO|nr:hypothetical protein K491DRAFT_590644 [Lophiostoma macrostomum CBS 122681]
MSLNGLDEAKVIEAYQGALAEGGGWFLLKYVSRDAVEVLARGTGGAADARGAIAQYEDKSPLYGFLSYRRRKVLIKYLPEGTSRLLQARVAVHFTAVTDKFTPHDTTISVTTAEELSDAALASACSLHTAAPSSCSSSGSSRRKLDEITEDAEEGQAPDEDTSTQARPATAASVKLTITEPSAPDATSTPQIEEPPAAPETHPPPPALERTTTSEEPKSAVSHITVEAVSEEAQKPEVSASEYRDSLKAYDDLFKHGPDPRFSSQTARPALSDLYAEIYAQYQPKVKLGPRPKQSLDTKRPHTSGPGAQNAARPVSTLPAGMRIANRKTAELKRPKSRDTSIVPSIAFPPPPPVPSIPDIPLSSPTFAPKSPASVRSMPMHSSRKANGMTPEKQRLMKAVELRKRQMKAKKEVEEKKAAPAPEEPAPEEQSASPLGPENITPEITTEALPEVPTSRDQAVIAGPEEDAARPDENTTEITTRRSPTPHEDPIEEAAPIHVEVDDVQSAASASSPTSAQTHGSSGAPSTRPSSISEDDNMLTEQLKIDTLSESTTTEDLQTPESPQIEDEKESIESSPTVVPDRTTPVPSVEVLQPDDTPETATQSPTAGPASDTAFSRRSKRESMVLMPLTGDADARSQRRSKRESMIFFPTPDSAHQGDGLSKREKRESMIFTAPNGESFGETKDRRRAMLEPIQIHHSAENSEAEYLSDDSFMEELQSAKFEEAKPVSVSKSPMAPFFSRKSSVSEISIPERSTSNQFVPGRLSPEQLKGRKASGPWPPQGSRDSVATAKKITVSSGISQRIKALAEKSNRDSSLSVSSSTTPDASASIVAQRKSSFFSTPPSGNSPSGKPISRLSRASFASLSITTTPDRKSVLQPVPVKNGPTVYNVKQGAEKPESVQVTARIIRDPRSEKPSLTMPTESTPLDLHQSQITIDHRKSNRPPTRSKSPVKAPPRSEPTSPRPPSSAHSREPSSSALPRSSSESSWRSFGRRLSESKAPTGPPRSHSTHSFESIEDKREEKKDKKDSRTSKLFKRMSTITSISRKNTGPSQILQEEDMQATQLPSLREPPPAVQVGDLNIQFPDTLLWKRRWVEIDGTGNLVLALSKSNEQSKGITKRFHLTEFRTPYAPDQDQQELPNSVILDFLDGRTLQCACETYVSQVQVLQILREAHDAWTGYGQGR